MQFLSRAGALILFCLASFACAGKYTPTGGPEDLTPPEIVKSEPLPRTLHFTGNSFKLEFSKYVDKLSLQNAIFISPNLGKLKFDWSGKEVEIKFSDTLRKNTTYILTLGTDLTDIRPSHNHLKDSYSLPFSTGGNIDSCSFAGKVFDFNPQGVLIFAYKLDSIKADTLNPRHTKPDFLTQTAKDGSFSLPYLIKGAYRLYAVRDEYKNLLYDVETDAIGMLPADDTLATDSSRISGLQFRLTTEDTTPPFIAGARSIDRYHVLVRFSEKMDTASIRLQNVQLFDTLTGAQIAMGELSFMDDSNTTMQFVTHVQDSGKGYRLTILRAADLAENNIRLSANTAYFTCTVNDDTLKPSVRMVSPIEGDRVVRPGDSVIFAFSEPVQRARVDSGFSMRDSSKKLVTGKIVWWGSARMAFVPASSLPLGMPYTVKLVLDSVRDVAGNTVKKDSMLTVHFQVETESSLGSAEGTVFDDAANGRGNIILSAIPVAGLDARSFRLTMPEAGKFTFEQLPEGKYRFFCFRDQDGNGKYSPGSVEPWKPAERFSGFQDTIKVRARWEVEGINLHIAR